MLIPPGVPSGLYVPGGQAVVRPEKSILSGIYQLTVNIFESNYRGKKQTIAFHRKEQYNSSEDRNQVWSKSDVVCYLQVMKWPLMSHN